MIYAISFPIHLLYREIEDTVLLALRSPEIYDDIARGTRRKYESNRPRAVLFEGPPGLHSKITENSMPSSYLVFAGVDEDWILLDDLVSLLRNWKNLVCPSYC